MSFPLTTLFSLACYFIAKKLLSTPKQTFLGLSIALIVMFVLMFKFHGFNTLAAHISITGCSLVILIVTFIEMSMLEKHMIKIKSGEIGSTLGNLRRFFSRFIKCYFFRKGYKEGVYGLIIAICAGLYPLISHIKAKVELS